MKKLFALFVTLVLFLGFAAPSTVDAAPAPGGPFASTVKLQNMGAEEATVALAFYNASGTKVYELADQVIAVNDTLVLYAPTLSSLASGEYSLVVSSNQPIASVSNFSDSDSDAAYTGFDEGSMEWYVPNLYDDYYSYYSNIYVQNVTDSAVDITLEVFAPNNPTPILTDTKYDVPAFASVQWDMTGQAALAQNGTYGGKITSTGNTVAIANIHGSGDTEKQLYSFNGYAAGSTTWFTPTIMNDYYGWNAAIVVQNVSNSTANIDVDYSTGVSTSYQINPQSPLVIYVPNISGLPTGSSGLFSAEITSDVDVVVMVNESNTYNRAATYNGFGSGTVKVYAPSVMKNVSDFSTSVTCQNVGTSPTRMQIQYFGQSGAGSTSASIPAGGTQLWYQPNESLPDGYDGNAIITSLDGQPIACIINANMESDPYFTQSMDMLSSYNGIDQYVE